jgi:hypothetical protein
MTSDLPTIDKLLEDAAVLEDEYTDDDVAALCDFALRELELPPLTVPTGQTQSWADRHLGRPEAGQPEIMAEPVLYAADHEQAGHDLDLAASLFASVPHAPALLEQLLDERVAPEGALVFACLLHLIGDTEAAYFWWRFAAGADTYGAAFCLFLYHRSRHEYRAARHWRAEARRMAEEENLHPENTVTLPKSLAENLGRILLHQCRRDRTPQLPPAVEAALNSLIAEGTATDRTTANADADAENQSRLNRIAIHALNALTDAIEGRRGTRTAPGTTPPTRLLGTA